MLCRKISQWNNTYSPFTFSLDAAEIILHLRLQHFAFGKKLDTKLCAELTHCFRFPEGSSTEFRHRLGKAELEMLSLQLKQFKIK